MSEKLPLPPVLIRWYFEHKARVGLTIPRVREEQEGDGRAVEANERLRGWLCEHERVPGSEELSNILFPSSGTSEAVRQAPEATGAAQDRFDKRSYQREYMRLKRRGKK